MHQKYSTLDIVRALKIPRERLRVWIDHGFISPYIQRAEGQGTKALFDRLDVYAIALFRKLLEMVLNRIDASRYLETWLKEARDRPTRVTASYNQIIFIRFVKKKSVKRGCFAISSPKNQSMSFRFQFSALGGQIDEYLKDKDWDDILVVNFKKIKAEVDASLE